MLRPANWAFVVGVAQGLDFPGGSADVVTPTLTVQ
jgi:hypothetical protein